MSDCTDEVEPPSTTDTPYNGPMQTPALSKRAAKKALRKQQKAIRKREALQAMLAESAADDGVADPKKPHKATGQQNISSGQNNASCNVDVGGKAARARLVRQNQGKDVGSSCNHRPQGGAPVMSQILPEHVEIVNFLEEKEREMRIKGRGIEMSERKVVRVDCHGSMEVSSSLEVSNNAASGKKTIISSDGLSCSLSSSNLRGIFSSSLSLNIEPSSLATILHLDISRNELWDLSANLSALSSLEILDISRNWFETIPSSISTLPRLKELRASHNLLKSSLVNNLRVDILKDMVQHRGEDGLQVLDIRFNQRCGKRTLLESLQSELGDSIQVHMTVTYPPPDDNCDDSNRVGASPAVRDAKLLRSQLEPWSTMALRRRLVADFGDEGIVVGEEGKKGTSTTTKCWADSDVTRGEVMDRLLHLYEEEKKMEKMEDSEEDEDLFKRSTDKSSDRACNSGRALVHVSGVSVNSTMRNNLLSALKQLWPTTMPDKNRERPSIRATNYMILCSPSMFEVGSKKAAKAAAKLKAHRNIWDLAHEAMMSVDPAFAALYTAVAVTQNFEGSPHIDKQNIGPFYGLALGDFEDGTGGIMVECSARVVAVVNTKNRMGKVDGRYPHWVAPYDTTRGERYSLIYYRTVGESEPIGPAVFEVPTSTC